MTEPEIQAEKETLDQESLPEEPEVTEESQWGDIENRISDGGLTEEDVEFMCDYFERFMDELDR